MSNSLQWRPTTVHLRAMSAALMVGVSGFGRVISIGGRAFSPHRLTGDTLIAVGVCGALTALAPVAGNVMGIPKAWAAERRRRSGLARDRKVRASRKQFVAARRTHDKHVDHIYGSSSDS